VAGAEIVEFRDYLHRTDGGPQSDLLVLVTAEPGLYAAVRPSGTEPKIKFYLFGRNVETFRLEVLANDLRSAAGCELLATR
jgi:phosphomannomutase